MTGFFKNGSNMRPRDDDVDEVRHGVAGLNFRPYDDRRNDRTNRDDRNDYNGGRSNYNNNNNNQRYPNESRGFGQHNNNYTDNNQQNDRDDYFHSRNNSNRNDTDDLTMGGNYGGPPPSVRNGGAFSGTRQSFTPLRSRYNGGMASMSESVTSSRTDVTDDVRTGLEDDDDDRQERRSRYTHPQRQFPSSNQHQQQKPACPQYDEDFDVDRAATPRVDAATPRSFQPSAMNAQRMANAGYDKRSSAFEPTARRAVSRMSEREPPNVLRRPQSYRPSGGGEAGGRGRQANEADSSHADNGTESNRDGGQRDNNRQGTKNRREKFMPPAKTAEELYDPSTQIQRGSRFEELFSAENDDRVQVTGAGNEPPRIQSFEECEFSPEIMKNMKLLNYRVPTQIQKFVIPLIMRKRKDIVGHASTGSGKTVAFFAPVIHKIQTYKRDNPPPEQRMPPYAPYVVVIAPTRELCQQLYHDALRLATNTGVSVHLSMGDMPMNACIQALRTGCDIFVATIGRTKHYADEKIISFAQVQYLIMDEVDVMVCKEKDQFDKLQSIVEQYDMNPSHRTLLFSATLSTDAQTQMSAFISNRACFVYVGEINRVVETVRQKFFQVPKSQKRELLLELLIKESEKIPLPNPGEFTYKPPKTIVFVSVKRLSDWLAIKLAFNGFQTISLNADRTLKQRITAIEKFSKGFYDVLVTTDVSSRGMNFPEVAHVINYDLPLCQELTYVHRLGRTGRAGNDGRATSFFDPYSNDKEFIDFYVDALKVAGLDVPQFMLEVHETYSKSGYQHAKGRIPPSRRDLGDRSWI